MKVAGLYNIIDLLIIPSMDGVDDFIAAMDYLESIKGDIEPNKIMFSFNRFNDSEYQNLEEQFDSFFDNVKVIKKEYGIDLTDKNNYYVLQDSREIKKAIKAGKTFKSFALKNENAQDFQRDYIIPMITKISKKWKKRKKMKIVVINPKGGSSKSTVAFQIISAYMLNKGLDFTHFELDDMNFDSETFKESSINTKQITIDNGDGLNETVRNLFLDNENFVLDVGGNKTTTMFLMALKKTRMYRKTDLYIIPSSGGSQDILNMKKTYDLIKEFDENAKVLFALSRVRNVKRIKFQYSDFFKKFKNVDYIVLKDSDVVDLSRKMQKSIFEIVQDEDLKKEFENLFDEALDNNDQENISLYSIMLEIIDDAHIFNEKYIINAFEKIDEVNKNFP